MENYIEELLINLNNDNDKVEKLKNELFKLELELNRLKSFTPTTSDLIFSFGDDEADVEENREEQEIIAKKIKAINTELRKYIK